MEAATGREPRPIGRTERVWLRLVFGGPVALWVPLARLVGVKVARDITVDDALLSDAEAGASEAARRFPAGLFAATAGVVGLLLWLPVERVMLEPYTTRWFDLIARRLTESGVSFWPAMMVTSTALLGVGVAVGIANALVFGAIPLLVLRRCTSVAAPAVAVAIAQGDAAIDGPGASAYPRVAYAAERILYPRGR